VNKLNSADAKISKLAQAVQAPAPPVLMLLKQMTGVQDGLDESGTAMIVVMPGKDADAKPLPAIFIPVTDYKKFVAAFDAKGDGTEPAEIMVAGSPTVVAKKGNFAVFAPAEQQEDLKAMLAISKNLASAMAPLDSWIARHDAAGVLTGSGIKLLAAKAREGMAQAKAGVPNDPDSAAMIESMFGAYDSVLASAGKELTIVAAGLLVGEDNSVQLNSRVMFAQGGQLATVSADVKKPATAALTGLPAGPFLFAADGPWPAAMSESMLKLSTAVFKNMGGDKKMTDAQAKSLEEAMAGSLRGVRGMSIVMGSPKPGGSLYGSTVAVIRVDDSKQYMANYEKSIQAMNEVIKTFDNPLMKTYKIEKLEAGGIKLTMDMSGMAGADPNGAKMMDMLFGPGGKLTAYVAAGDANTVVLSYTSLENLKRAIEAQRAAKPGLAADADIAKIAGQLPTGSQWVAYWSPKATIELGKQIFMAAAPPGFAPKFPEFPKTPAIGMAIKLSATGADTSLVIPAEVIAGFGQFIQQIQQMNQPGADAPLP